MRQRLIGIQPSVGAVPRFIVGFEVAQRAEELGNLVGAKVKAAACVRAKLRLLGWLQFLDQPAEFFADDRVVCRGQVLADVDRILLFTA